MFDHLTIEWLKISGLFLGLAVIGWLVMCMGAASMRSEMEERLEDMRANGRTRSRK